MTHPSPPTTRWITALMAAACLAGPAIAQDAAEEESAPDPEPAPGYIEAEDGYSPGSTSAARSSSGSFGSSTPAPEPVPVEVELELTLLVDSSASVDDSEFTLQRQGYIDAFRDPEVQAAIVALDGVVVNYYEWSSYGQGTTFGDQLLETEADCRMLASSIESDSTATTATAPTWPTR